MHRMSNLGCKAVPRVDRHLWWEIHRAASSRADLAEWVAMASAMAADVDQEHADLVVADLVVAGPEHAAWDSEAEWVSAVKVADLAADLTAVDQDAESLVVEAF